MENISNAKYKMILSTSQRLSQNASLVNSLPSYSTISTQFLSDFAQLQSVCEQLQVSKTGVYITKKALRKDMADKSLDIALKVRAFAKISGNETLWAECNISKSSLYYGKELDARNNAMVVYNKATANVTALATYGVTAVVLTTLKAAIDAFSLAIPSTRFTRTEKKDLVVKREKYITACNASLSKVDALVELLKVTQPTFYLQYKEARRILRNEVTLSLKGLVKDAATGESLSGVSLSLLPVAENAVSLRAASLPSSEANVAILNKRTAQKGGFNVRNLPAGVYTLSISKYGYATQLQSITVNPSETTHLHVQLEKTA